MFNTMKFFKWFGTVFMGIGIVATAGMILGGIASKTYDFVGFALIWGAVFIGVGALFRTIGAHHEKAQSDILNQGKSYEGIIYRYDTDKSVMINGSYPLSVVVRYMADGMVREAVIPTMDTSAQSYPIGYSATIKVFDGKAAIVPGSVQLSNIPNQETLLDESAVLLQTAPRIGVTCPHCGASVTVPLGGSTTCEFCGSRITIDKNGKIV